MHIDTPLTQIINTQDEAKVAESKGRSMNQGWMRAWEKELELPEGEEIVSANEPSKGNEEFVSISEEQDAQAFQVASNASEPYIDMDLPGLYLTGVKANNGLAISPAIAAKIAQRLESSHTSSTQTNLIDSKDRATKTLKASNFGLNSLFKAAQYSRMNVHITFSGDEVKVWVRDFKKEHTDRLPTMIAQLRQDLSEMGFKIHKVMVNGAESSLR